MLNSDKNHTLSIIFLPPKINKIHSSAVETCLHFFGTSTYWELIDVKFTEQRTDETAQELNSTAARAVQDLTSLPERNLLRHACTYR